MLTIFSCAKPFTGREGLIQRNALKSWKLLDPQPEIILFDDAEGARGAAAEFGIRHEPRIEKNRHNAPQIRYLFTRAREIARHDLICYANCDMILMSDFTQAVRKVSLWRRKFLMIGRRCNLDVIHPVDFHDCRWEAVLKERCAAEGKLMPAFYIDYFVFPRGLYCEIPPFALGRPRWDNWLVWKARSLRAPVVDASESVLAVHQNHEYGAYSVGPGAYGTDEQARDNHRLAGGERHWFTIDDATYKITSAGIRRNWRFLGRYARSGWHWLCRVSLPVRKKIGLRHAAIAGFFNSRRGGLNLPYGE